MGTCKSEKLDSLSKMVGHFPPSSRVTGVKCFAAADIMRRPTRGLPAKQEFRITSSTQVAVPN